MIRQKLVNCMLFAMCAWMLAGPQVASAQRAVSEHERARIAKEVRHELAMLPYYSVFDNLAFKVEGTTVTLLGQVTRPTLKSDAQSVIKDIEGVEEVVNKIEVLPPSSMDERIRLATYRSIYGESGLPRYGLAAVPSIHIIVNNGRVTLEGVVDNENDRNIANIRANSVPGVFAVTNNLKVQKS
jgi:hyperosmotically inducible periplasmic protein